MRSQEVSSGMRLVVTSEWCSAVQCSGAVSALCSTACESWKTFPGEREVRADALSAATAVGEGERRADGGEGARR